MGELFYNLGVWKDFVKMIVAIKRKELNIHTDFFKLLLIYLKKNTIHKLKRHKNWEQLFAFLQVSKKKANTSIKNRQRILAESSQEKNFRWLVNK